MLRGESAKPFCSWFRLSWWGGSLFRRCWFASRRRAATKSLCCSLSRFAWSLPPSPKPSACLSHSARLLAGMLLGSSAYAHKMAAQTLPIRDAFVALFFVTIGMLIDPRTWLANWGLLLVLVALIVDRQICCVVHDCSGLWLSDADGVEGRRRAYANRRVLFHPGSGLSAFGAHRYGRLQCHPGGVADHNPGQCFAFQAAQACAGRPCAGCCSDRVPPQPRPCRAPFCFLRFNLSSQAIKRSFHQKPFLQSQTNKGLNAARGHPLFVTLSLLELGKIGARCGRSNSVNWRQPGLLLEINDCRGSSSLSLDLRRRLVHPSVVAAHDRGERVASDHSSFD